MANTLNDLYLKYINKVGKTLESDRYFQYLFEIVNAGETEVSQKNRILHKVVDERWLTTIEDALDPLNKIINNPRRFITTDEEVVPVSLARKITGDSVRHLSQNTQFLASSEDGDVRPTKVLNVTTRETYDLYENRFIYHLIQRLVTFIDKRTDLIFWSTGDETAHVMTLNSKIDDAYEEIGYKLEMTIKNRQSFAENDADNMEVFMRIDRVRRMVTALKRSSFCEIMAGCSTVRSPIQRTNLLTKDPDYKKCLNLWKFLENYDDVGYSIEAIDSDLEFDEEYMNQMFTNLITNYTVFKSLLEDPRELEEVVEKRRKVRKPKFIKQLQEEYVDDIDIPDVEVKRIFVEEVTQAQLDAEQKLADVTAERDELQGSIEEMKRREESAITRAQLARADTDAAEKRANEAELARVNQLRRAMEAEEQRDIARDEKMKAETAMNVAMDDLNEAMAAIKAERAQLKAQTSENKKAMQQNKAEAREALKEAKASMKESQTMVRDAEKAGKLAAKNEAAAVSAREKALQKEKEATEARKLAEKQAKADEKARAKAEEKEKAALAAKEEAVAANQGLIDSAKAAEAARKAAEKEKKAADRRIKQLEKLLAASEKARSDAEAKLGETAQKLAEETARYEAAEKRAEDNTLGGILSNTFGRRKEN